jgi:hypothetical protein
MSRTGEPWPCCSQNSEAVSVSRVGTTRRLNARVDDSAARVLAETEWPTFRERGPAAIAESGCVNLRRWIDAEHSEQGPGKGKELGDLEQG